MHKLWCQNTGKRGASVYLQASTTPTHIPRYNRKDSKSISNNLPKYFLTYNLIQGLYSSEALNPSPFYLKNVPTHDGPIAGNISKQENNRNKYPFFTFLPLLAPFYPFFLPFPSFSSLLEAVIVWSQSFHQMHSVTIIFFLTFCLFRKAHINFCRLRWTNSQRLRIILIHKLALQIRSSFSHATQQRCAILYMVTDRDILWP